MDDNFALEQLIHQMYPKKVGEFKICQSFDECLSEIEKSSKCALATSHEYIIKNCEIFASKYCFKNPEIIYNYALKFLVSKDFSYLKELNRFIDLANAGGSAILA